MPLSKGKPHANERGPKRPTPKRGRRPAGEISGKDAILAAALPAFATKGFDSVDLRGLAADAQVHMALIGQTFGSKAKLWDAVIDNLAAEQQNLLPAIASLCAANGYAVEERLKNLIVRFVQISEDRPYLHQLLMRESMDPGPRLDKLVQCLIVPFYMAVRPLLQEAVRSNVVRVAEPLALFFLIVNTVATHVTNHNLMNTLAKSTGDRSPNNVIAVLTSMLLSPANDAPRKIE